MQIVRCLSAFDVVWCVLFIKYTAVVPALKLARDRALARPREVQYQSMLGQVSEMYGKAV